MASGKRPAGSALQITFESAGPQLVGEGEVADELPRATVDRGLILSSIVTGEPGSKVARESDVAPLVVDGTLEPSPSLREVFADLSGWRPSTSARGLPAVGSAEAGGEGGIRTHGTLSGTPDFESGTIDHSATSPAQDAKT